ncbi:MAG: glycosyl hydrolase family 28-related protein, partial [Dehalococcoidales bacterium]|nr:glycosyl hydrolase family 28-related protein [Dehalococcoidales bacterium]
MKRKILSILLTLAGVSSLGLVSALPVVANGGEPLATEQTLNVANWTGPDNVTAVEEETDPTGRQATIKVGEGAEAKYHMWYSSSDEKTLYYTSSDNPYEGFAERATCEFTGNTPADVGSVTVMYEGDTFYMITYLPTGQDNAKGQFAIYTSEFGTEWEFEKVVFDGKYGENEPFYKIDGPCLMKENDNTYRLYFQGAKTGTSDNYHYDIFMAEATDTSLSEIADSVNFTLGNLEDPVLLSGSDEEWDSSDVMHPMVVKDSGMYYMWYSAHEGTNQQIGFASSDNGIVWVKSRGNPILPRNDTYYGFAEPSVIKDGNTWRIWYTSRDASLSVKYIKSTGPFEFSSIQAAIDKAEDGDTIQVAAGTYEAGFDISEKTNITIIGAPAKSTVIAPDALIDTGVAHKYTPDMKAVVFVNNSTGITIQNFTFKSTLATPGSGGADAIVFWNASSGEISDCVAQGIYEINGVQTGQGIAVDAGKDETTNLALNEVDIEGFQKNAIDILDGNGNIDDNEGTINVTITGGTITGAGPTDVIAQNGIMLWNRGGGKINVAVSGVTLSGFEYTLTKTPAACAIYNYGTANSNLTVTDSTFTENQVQVFDRNLSGDLSSAFEENTFDLAVLGKKTESGSLANVIFGSIQAAVTEAKNGDTIQVAAGTYDEGEITVAKELAIIGVADSGDEKPVIKGTLKFTDNADGSSLENLKFVAKIGTEDKRGDNIVLTKVENFSIVDCEFDGNVDLTGDEPDDFTWANRAVQINSSGNNITIDNCKFYGGYYVTIQGYADNLTVKDCVIEDVKSGINLITGSNLTVENTNISVIPQGEDNDTYCVRF